MKTFFISVYGLICVGYVVGLLNNDDIPNTAKILMVIFSPILTPFLLSAGLGIIMVAKIKEKQIENKNYEN